MKKIKMSNESQAALAWFFCGYACMLLLFVIGIMSNVIKVVI